MNLLRMAVRTFLERGRQAGTNPHIIESDIMESVALWIEDSARQVAREAKTPEEACRILAGKARA